VFLESFPTSNISSLKPQPRYLPSISQRMRHCCNSCCWRTFRSNEARENNQFSNFYNNDDNDDEQNLYYQDDFNDAPWSCRMGTTEEHGIWMNYSDQAGTIMAMLVWILMVYSCLTVTFLARTGGIPVELSMMYSIFVTLALASHAKTTLSDPGTIPASAVPTEEQRKHAKLNMCSQCQTFKPPFTHHCRICNRCISRMDHHCPWMNNCIGVANMKHFILFLTYTWICSVYSLTLLGWNYFFCSSEDCTFTPVLLQLVRFMTILGIGTFLFTSSMLMNVAYGLMTGIGTIDRLKKKATNTMQTSDEEPIPLNDVFGVGPLWTWIFPIDPLFDDYDRVSGYSTPQRLLREQMKLQNQPNDMSYPPSVISQYTPV
jgi:palmitoyltransferase ZDHHC3/7/25